MGVADTGAGSFFVKRKSCRDQTNYICINEKEEDFHQLSEKRSRDIIFLSSNQSLLDLARDVDVPAIAYQKPETDTFLHADMVVEGVRGSRYDVFYSVCMRDISTFHGRFWRRNAVL
mgnify:CR=1 FL=1